MRLFVGDVSILLLPDLLTPIVVLRDIGERGRSYNEVLQRYNRFVRPDYRQFIKPTMKYAHIIVPSNSHHEIIK